ncbi:root phototropism protein 2-like [Rhodamnia argentea]|uniref:Root phototropism protein 2-like n=1 Tax=Rhodamnia argentea TaxID=178133 RepID=A0A8B8MLT9_9MYRT|nr:root phototropism protein 2-like [Rhodamnia argentea]
MASHEKSNGGISVAMERPGQWLLSQKIPTDVEVKVGKANFSLHKFMLVAKSNYLRKMVIESKEVDLTRIDLSNIPGGPEVFEKVASFCYNIDFEITVKNVAALRCAAEYLEMTDQYCDDNLAGRTEDFLVQVAFPSVSGTILVLKSCEDLLPMAEDLKIVQRCLDVASAKVCKEAIFPSRSPSNWWTIELSVLNVAFFGKIIAAMQRRGAKALILAMAIITYAERSLPGLVRDHSGVGTKSPDINDSHSLDQQRELLESIVALFPREKAAFPINFLCCLLRAAIFLKASTNCKKELEKRVSSILEHVTVDDLLVLSFSYDGERLFNLESVRRIISAFVEKEKSVTVFSGDLQEACSAPMERVAKMVDAYLGEIAIYGELSISKFNAIATLVPKAARKVDDDLYRAIDIYFKAHPNLDEIEREKACSVMNPLKLSPEARLHASQNKRLPVRTVLHALYHDQLKLRSGMVSRDGPHPVATRSQVLADVSLVRENETLRSELMMMKMYVSDMSNPKSQGTTSSKGGPKKTTFFSSMTKTLGKLNPFRHGPKDASNIDDDVADVKKPRRRRFSIS